MVDLQNKAFIVTGGGSGIGAATVKRLASGGADVVAADIHEGNLLKTCVQLDTLPGKVFPVTFDLASEESVISLVKQAIDKLGRLDGLVNVAADVSTATMAEDTEIGSATIALWQRVLNTNLIGTGLMIRECLPHLEAAGGGSIVNISSAAAWMGEPARPAYAASKSGIHALTRHTARAWGGKSIRCNTIAPGLVLSEAALELNPKEYLDAVLAGMCLPRLGKPEDVASSINFLLSDDASWISGQILSVDGGLTLRE